MSFCATGQGGGIDPTCSPKDGGGGGGKVKKAEEKLTELKNERSTAGLREKVEEAVKHLSDKEVMDLARKMEGRAGRNRKSATEFLYIEVSSFARALESQKV